MLDGYKSLSSGAGGKRIYEGDLFLELVVLSISKGLYDILLYLLSFRDFYYSLISIPFLIEDPFSNKNVKLFSLSPSFFIFIDFLLISLHFSVYF